MGHLPHKLAALAVLTALALPAAQTRAAPDPNWIVSDTQNDCSGSGDQGTPACDSYATDLYESIDYSFVDPGTADIQTIRTGADDDYYYVEWDLVSPWDIGSSTGHAVVVEIDVDGATESDRGDYYIGMFQKSEFDSTSWVDAFSQGGYESYEDVNDDVGGANPTTSDFGGSSGDGYDTALSQGSDRVWGRIVGGNFQVAVRRTLVGDPAVAALRPWSRQSTSLSKDKLYFHDQNPIADVAQIDNLSGVGLGWIPVRPPQPDLLVLKLVQVIQDPFNGTTNPKAIPGAIAMYTLQVTNTGPGTVDTDSLMVTDPIPSEVALVISDFDVANPGPAAFVDGTPSSALSYTFISLGSSTDDIEFSSDGGSTWAYTPVDSGNGTDPAVTNVRINPKGTMAAGGSPSFQLFFKVRVP